MPCAPLSAEIQIFLEISDHITCRCQSLKCLACFVCVCELFRFVYVKVVLCNEQQHFVWEFWYYLINEFSLVESFIHTMSSYLI